MLLTHMPADVLHTIATKARSLSECLQLLSTDGSIDSVQEDELPDIERRLELWCQVVAKGDWSKFQRRLEWDGLTLETARLLVSDAVQMRSPILPPWVRTLEQIIETAQKLHRHPPKDTPRALKSDRPIPFEDFYLPCLQVAQRLLQTSLIAQSKIHVQGDSRQCLDDFNQRLASDAQMELERQLLNSLAFLCVPTLMREFKEFRTTGNVLRDFLTISIQGPSKRDRYQAFLEHWMQDGLLSLFEQYSVLGRLVVTMVEHWVNATAELFTRLLTDWSALERQFSPHQVLAQVVAIEAGQSDSHNQGRSVAIITFDTGLKLVYKPKNLGLEAAFGELVNWCNQQGMPLGLKAPQILDCSTYGWAEYIDKRPCKTEAEVHRFYQRSGLLLCLIHTLEGTDCHYENLIAHGEHPVLIDMETLLHPDVKSTEPAPSFTAEQLAETLSTSVLRTALLPVKELSVANDLQSLDMSGLGKIAEQAIAGLAWKHINTDGMTIDVNDVTLTPEANVPTLDGVAISSEGFVAAIADGFEQMYRWLMRHKESVLADNSPLMRLANQECRLVFRHTRVYATILARSYDPNFMQIGMARSAALDVLSRAFLVTAKKPHFWEILASEIQSLEQLDIPLLTVNTSSLHMSLPTGAFVSNLCERSGFERVLSRIQAMSENDLHFQCQTIYLSLCSRFLKEPQCEAIASQNLSEQNTTDCSNIICFEASNSSSNYLSYDSKNGVLDHTIDSTTLVNKAIDLAQILQQQSILTTDDGLAWLGIEYLHSSQSFYIQSGELNLYDGCCGMALFLGALAHVSGDLDGHDRACKALYPLHLMLQLEPPLIERVAKKLGIGGGTGLASLVYTLTHLSQWLNQPTLLDDALQIARLITPDRIAADRSFDVSNGAAGTILGLLPLLDAVDGAQHSTILKSAIAAGEHLLEHQTSTAETPKAWKTWRDQSLTGFSQGAAGIAYALLRLFAVTQDDRFLQAAKEAIAYEQTQFSEDAKNWLDLRSSASQCQISWAHGAPGIALARLGGLAILDTPEIRQDVAIALDTTQHHLVWGIDSLCWGNLGRIETLLVAAHQLNRPDLLTLAHQATAVVLSNQQTRGVFDLFHTPPHPVPARVINPGLFHGLSGVGYQLLRLAHPNQLPSILLWN